MKNFLGIVSLMVATGFIASASEYPMDYETMQTCKHNGPVTVCRAMKTHDGSASLQVWYDGKLLNEPGLRAYVQVNYLEGSRSATFAMGFIDQQHNTDTSLVQITGGCLRADAKSCQQWGSPEMKNLLFWAQQPYQFKLNKLDLEVAFVSENAEKGWDNNGGYGNNYHFSFDEN